MNMKYLVLLISIMISSLASGQTTDKLQNDSIVTNPNFDKQLADRLGGDDFGMKMFYLVILKTLVDEGKMIVAGPLGKNENSYRGIFILDNINSLEEANEILNTDRAIEIGLLDYDIYEWYGSAALPEYLPFSDKIWKLNP